MMRAPSSTDWDTLGLAPTGDEDAVRAAYRARLRDVGPDKDPEGFQALRMSYETVLAALASDAEADAKDDVAQADGTVPDAVIAFLAELTAHRTAGDEAGAIALVDATMAGYPPGSAELAELEHAVLRVVALSEPLSPGLFRHLADRFDWRDMGGRAARSDPEQHAAVLDRVAAQDWFDRFQVAAGDAAGRVERLMLMPGREALSALSERALSPDERHRVRVLFDELLEHGGFLLPRFDGETLALLREAVEGPPLLGDSAPTPAATQPGPITPSRLATRARVTPTETGTPPANRKLTLLVVIVAILVMGAIKIGIDRFRSAPVGVADDGAPSTDVAVRTLKDPATPWLLTRDEPDGVFVDWSPMVRLRNGLSDIRIGAETPQPTTAMPVPTMPIQGMGFLAPPTLTYMTMRIRTRDGRWSEIRRYPLTKAAR